MSNPISRFAPSPTGYLHIGGARTALFAYLYAKKLGGKFKLRIEDTDLNRSTKESIKTILEAMKWLGLDYDSDIVYQTKNLTRHKQIINKLLTQDDAYYCQCTQKRLNKLREKLKIDGKKAKYDGKCRDKGLKCGVVRFKNPVAGSVVINDLIKGDIIINNSELDDLIIARSDGSPTYNLSVVVDDIDMGVSIVIRGNDHINNTPRQINLYNALGAKKPNFAHLPMILNENGTRLSKRYGAMSVMQYKEDGFLPDALLNYILRLGFSYGDKEIFSQKEMLELFELARINKSPANFDNNKLLWLNQQYIKNTSNKNIFKHLKYHLHKNSINYHNGIDILSVIGILKLRVKTLVEMTKQCKMFYQNIDKYDEKIAKKQLNSKTKPVLELLLVKLANLDIWTSEVIHQVISDICVELNIGFGKVGQPFRLALSGNGISPSIDITAEFVGREQTIIRLKNAIDYIKKL